MAYGLQPAIDREFPGRDNGAAGYDLGSTYHEMQLAKVIGDIVATQKDANLAGVTLLVLQPIALDGSSIGRTLVAVDSVGAGVGETVFFVRGKEASFPFHPTEVPADAGIVGIVDHWDLG